MEGLGAYLARYRSLEPPHASMARMVCAVVRDECGITLSEKELRFTQGGVLLSCHPVVRSEVVVHAPRILAILREKHGVRLSHVR